MINKEKVQIQIDFILFTNKNKAELKKVLRESILNTVKTIDSNIDKFKDIEKITIYTSNK